jgi:hypothetical protein
MSTKIPEKSIGITLSPNPATQYVLIQGNETDLGTADLHVFDATGNKILLPQTDVSYGEKGIIWIIDPTLSPGLYLVQIIGNEMMETKKLILMK